MKLTKSIVQQIINEELETFTNIVEGWGGKTPPESWEPILAGTQRLRKGSKGEAVMFLQQLLKEQGLGKYLGTSGPNNDGVDGKFGGGTRKAVRRFQMKAFPCKKSDRRCRRKNWDGVVGEGTAGELIQAWGGGAVSTAPEPEPGEEPKKDDDGRGWSLAGMMRGAERAVRTPQHWLRKHRGITRKVNGIAVAWPDYKPGISKTGWMKYLSDAGMTKSPMALGHAGVVLIDEKGQGFYFDFGRYKGADPGNGIIRGPFRVRTRAIWAEDGNLKNKEQFLKAVQSTRGANQYGGEMMAALIRNVNFQSAYNYAKSNKGKKLPYNLIQNITEGENCATFVARVMEAGGAGSWSTSLRKQFIAVPASIVETLANEEDEEVITV